MNKMVRYIFITLFGASLVACGSSSSDNSSSKLSGGGAESTISDKADIVSNTALEPHFSDDFMEDMDLADELYEDEDVVSGKSMFAPSVTGAPNSALTGDFPRWGRKITDISINEFNIDVNGNEATVYLKREIDGILFVDNTDNSTKDFVEKEFEVISERSSTFIREDGKRWKLKSISPVDVDLKDETEQTVEIQKVEAIVSGVSRFVVTDPAVEILVKGELAEFKPGEEVVVEATVNNSSGSSSDPKTFVFLRKHGNRDRMFDDGQTGGDRVADDGIYTVTYTVKDSSGKHFAIIDVLDGGTLNNNDAGYNSTIWGIPYKIDRSDDNTDETGRDVKKLIKQVKNNPLFWKPVNNDISKNGVAYRFGKEDAPVFWGREAKAIGRQMNNHEKRDNNDDHGNDSEKSDDDNGNDDDGDSETITLVPKDRDHSSDDNGNGDDRGHNDSDDDNNDNNDNDDNDDNDDNIVTVQSIAETMHGRKFDIDIEIDGDTANVSTSALIHGKFNTAEAFPSPVNRTRFREVMKRKAVYEKQADGDWELKSISPAIVTQSDNSETVKIDALTVTVNDAKEFEAANMNFMQSLSENMPEITVDDDVLVEVAASNSGDDGLFVYVRIDDVFRTRLYDDGTHGDKTSGDGIFSVLFASVDISEGFHKIAIDAVSGDMLKFENSGDYNSNAVGFIFQVVE